MLKGLLTKTAATLTVATIMFTGCASYEATPTGNPHVLGKKPILDSALYPKNTKVGIYEDGSRYIDYKGIRYIGEFDVKTSCKDFEIKKEDIKYTSATGKGTIVVDLKDDKTMVEFTETKVCHLGDIYIVKLSDTDQKVVHHE